MSGVEHSLSRGELARYVAAQMSSSFPDREVRPGEIEPHLGRALERLDFCFSRIRNKHYGDGQRARFDHLHADQYAAFLYLLANTIFREDGDRALAGKAYGLNRHGLGLDIYFEVELPDVFFLQHPVGTVLGRAHYASYFMCWQRTSVGGNVDLEYPRFEEGVVLYGNSSVIGKCSVGSGACLSYGALLMDTDAPPENIVFGASPNNAFKPSRRRAVDRYFHLR